MHMKQEQKPRPQAGTSVSSTNQTKRERDDKDILIRNLQREIVQLENKLCKKEDQIESIMNSVNSGKNTEETEQRVRVVVVTSL